MGTRNLTCVVKDEKIKVAQYGQWDGYPTGQGATIVHFITKQMNPATFIKALDNCRFITDEESQNLWVECGAERGSNLVNMDVSAKFGKKYPTLCRDTGGEILSIIQQNNGGMIEDSSKFAADSLFCEFAYVLDMDNCTLEVYTGFNKGEPTGRFANLDTKESEYNPVTLFRAIPFAELNDDTMAGIEAELNEDE